MKKILTVISSVGIMLCLGSMYAWSNFVPKLKESYGFSTTQTQIIFGALIAVFVVTMIPAGHFERKFGTRITALMSAILFGSGYLLAGFSGGNFILMFLGVGVLGGMGTGFGYLAALTTPVKWFPKRKGLITGIAAAGFGLAAIITSFASKSFFDSGKNVLEVLAILGAAYGLIILFFSFFMNAPIDDEEKTKLNLKEVLKSAEFLRPVFGMFFGTFAGLLVIGNLEPMGAVYSIDANMLKLGISVFAAANFTGRLTWGFLSDIIGSKLGIFLSLTFQAFGIFLIGHLELNAVLFILLSASIGFGFGGNFVLFARETAHEFGIANLGAVYPFVFLGYAVAGILGPMTGGIIFDTFEVYTFAAYIASGMSLIGGIIFLFKKEEEVNVSA